LKKEIIDYLNLKAGTAYRHGTKKVASVVDARIAEGALLDNFKKCIDNKVAGWKGTTQEIYLRPETLFGTKFWGYVNEKTTNVLEVGNREELIKAVLKASGMRDILLADVMIYNEVLKLIPTEKLPQFAVSVIRNNNEFMRADQAISKAVREFETKILLKNMQDGKQIKDFEKFIEFIQYSFRGKSICNNLAGMYKPFVTIGMDKEGNLVNQFIWKKVSSGDEQNIYKWLFENQKKIGVVEYIEVKMEEVKKIEKKDETKITSKEVNKIIASVTKRVKI